MRDVLFTREETARFFVHAGPESLEVQITNDILLDEDGNEVDAAIDCEAKAILINAALPRARWCIAVRDQMHVAHDRLFGEPTTPALMRVRREVVYAQFMRDLGRQGGADALLGLPVVG